MITCRSSAKINLTLDILSRRADGYHELQSIAHTIGIWDELAFDFDVAPGFSLVCNRDDLTGDDNLCLKAVRAWSDTAKSHGVELSGVRISLTKNIPSGAGLGGGSGNAAATLLALNSRFDSLLDEVTLTNLAASLGADVPFFLRGGCALFEGIGERLTPLSPLDSWVLVVKPDVGLSTPAVFRQWDALNLTSRHRTSALQSALQTGELKVIGEALGNDLRIAAQASGVDVESLISRLHRTGALGVEMTGSGSAVYALFAEQEEAARVAEQFKAQEGPVVPFVCVAPLCRQAVVFGAKNAQLAP